MINWRKKDFSNPPTSLTYTNNIKVLAEAEKATNGKLFKKNHYGSKKVLNLLRAYSIDQDTFNDDTDLAKCFYCESTSEIVATLQVEHYRPKARIDDKFRKEVTGTNGYFWLGIEWTNLILSCPKCNGKGAKGNIFTIAGKRHYPCTSLDSTKKYNRTTCNAELSPLIDEKPDLLHPEIDNSFDFISFNNEGKVTYKHHRGKRTIEICKLDRKQLNIVRANLILEFQNHFITIVQWNREKIISDQNVIPAFIDKCKLLRARYDRKLSYTLLARYMIMEFEVFFVQNMPKDYQEKLRNAFVASSS